MFLGLTLLHEQHSWRQGLTFRLYNDRLNYIPYSTSLFMCYCIVGVSMSEPHISELKNRIFLIYVYICYHTCVYCTRIGASCISARGQYACDLTACAHLDTFMVAFLFRIQFQVVLLLVVNIDTLNTSRRVPKPSQGKKDRPQCRRE